MQLFFLFLLVACIRAHDDTLPSMERYAMECQRYAMNQFSVSDIVPLTLLPQDAGDESPAGLDGGPYGFYFRKSATGSTKWTINIQGGGWCYDEEQCYLRSQTFLGSSKKLPTMSGCDCMNVKEDGSMDNECNCIFMPYLDGASFSGFRPEPWQVSSDPSKVLYFRGIKNLDATIDFAFAHGLDKASEFVLTGGSAGGLSTFLHADRLADRIHSHTPDCLVLAAPQVGYFLDHDNYKHDSNNYTAFMKYIYHMQNLTSTDGALYETCMSDYASKPWYCFMSPHMQSYIQTPFFMFNSKYDEWQLENELQLTADEWQKTKEGQEAVIQYGKDFMAQFAPIKKEAKHGAMITSCICHSCPWTALKLEGKSSYQHYADWYYDHYYSRVGPNRSQPIHIDTRGPNGDGTLPGCKPFLGSSDASPFIV